MSLFVLLALFAPTLLPAGAKQGWAGELLLRVNPMTAAEHYIAQHRHQPVRLDEGAVLARLADRGERSGLRSSRSSSCRGS